MAFDPDIERVNPYSNLNPRVTAPESKQERRQRRRSEGRQLDEPEDVLDLHEDEAQNEPGDVQERAGELEERSLDLSA